MKRMRTVHFAPKRTLAGGLTALLVGSTLAAGTVPSLAAGLPHRASAHRAGAPVTVSIWSWRSQDAGMWQKVQAALRRQGIQVTIRYRPINPTSYDSVLQTAMDGGKGPDLFYGRAGELTFQYGVSGLVTRLNGLVSFSNFVPSSLAAVEYKGNIWGVPLDEETMEIFYNKQIFARYHLTPPQTWAQFLHICQVLKSHGVTPIYTMPIQTWMLALNIDEISATMLGDQGAKALVDRKMTFDSPAYIHVLTLFKSLTPYFEPNFMAVGSAGDEQEVALATGRAAMVMDGIYDVPTMVQYGMSLKNLGAFLVPPENPHTQRAMVDWYPDATLQMNAHIANPAERQAALAILRYATTRAFGQDFADIAGEISPIRGVVIPSRYPLSVQAYHWYQTVAVNPLIGIRSPMDTPPPTPLTSKSKSVNTQVGIFTAESNEVQSLLSGKVTPAQAAAAIQKAVSWYFHS